MSHRLSSPSTRSSSRNDRIQDLHDLLNSMTLSDSSFDTVTWRRNTTESITLSRSSRTQSTHTSAPSKSIPVPPSPPATTTSQTPLQPRAPRPSNDVSAVPHSPSQTISLPTATRVTSQVRLVPKPEEIRPPQAGLRPDGFWVITVSQEVGIFYHWADVAERTNFISGNVQKCYPSFQEALKVYTVKFNEGSIRAVPIPGGPFWPSPPSPSLSVDSDELWLQVDDLSETMSQFRF